MDNNNNIVVNNKALEFQNIRDNELDKQEKNTNGKLTHEQEQKNLNKIVSDLQQASASGLTKLNIRDVPRCERHLVQDEQTNVSYLPENEDYIKEDNELENELNYNLKGKNSSSNSSLLDTLYEELSVPLLLFVLFFIFQLNYINNFLFKNLKFLFNETGNMNLQGYLIKSFLFTSIYYSLNKVQLYLSI